LFPSKSECDGKNEKFFIVGYIEKKKKRKFASMFEKTFKIVLSLIIYTKLLRIFFSRFFIRHQRNSSYEKVKLGPFIIFPN
jgi:hypothetical protein